MKPLHIIRIATLLPILAVQLHAQVFTVAEDQPVPDKIRIKFTVGTLVSPDAVTGMLAAYAPEYHVASVTPWISPELLDIGPALYSLKERTTPDVSPIRQRLEGLSRIVEVRFLRDYDTRRLATKLSTLPHVEYAEPVWRRTLNLLPNDSYLPDQSYLSQLHASEAWDLARADATVVISVIDSGIDPDHPDLKKALWTNSGETGKDLAGNDRRTNGVDDDGNGFTDDWRGYDFAGVDGNSGDNDPRATFAHGVHVAGIAAATGDNSEGVAGIGFGATIMPVKITADTGVSEPDLVRPYEALLYSATMGANIINCSWGGYGPSKAEQEVIDVVTSMGALVIAAAGNEGRGIPIYPAAYRNVISVGSVSRSDQRSLFSNYHESIDIVAPGEDVLSTIPVTSGSYGRLSGTSMAAPMVSGAAALVLSRFGVSNLTPEQLGAILKHAADDIYGVNPDYRALLGAGRLNVGQSVVIGPNAVYAEIVDHKILSEGDQILHAGGEFDLQVTIRNVLAPGSELMVTAEVVGDYPVSILNPTISIEELGTGESSTNSSNPFRFVLSEELPFDVAVPLQFTVRDAADIVSVKRTAIMVNPSFETTSTDRIALTLSGNGRLGYIDFPNNVWGRGFRLDGSSSLLAEGGLLIGTSEGALADAVRNGSPINQNSDLAVVAPFRTTTEANGTRQYGTAAFTESASDKSQLLGLDVSLNTIAVSTPELDRQVLLLYTIRNTSDRIIEDLHCSLFLDWDLGPLGRNNRTMFDPENRMGVTSNVYDSRWPVTGAILVSDQEMNFTALDNEAGPLTDGFTKAEKWDAMSRGIGVEESAIGDNAMLLGAGPISLMPGDSTVVAFSLLAGETSDDLKRIAEQVRGLYKDIGHVPGSPVNVAHGLALDGPSPNPFVDQTTISYTIPEETYVKIDIYSLDGRHVKTLVDDWRDRGSYSLEFSPPDEERDVRSTWLVRLYAGARVETTKLIYLGRRPD